MASHDGLAPTSTPDGPAAPHGLAAATLRDLLDLLGRQAPAESFARPVAAAREAGAGPAELAYVEEAAETALAIRRTLDQHRRREAELSALFDTAGDLAALSDLDAVLRAIVRRARLLLRTDVAYLTLNDPAEGDTFMRVTDGSTSARFQLLRLGMGEGLGGLVAQTARPYASADYRADTRFKHTDTIDTGVGEEGLRGILGVPLRVGSRVIGVLYAADRTPRDFDPDQIALLASLADHAAVAIDSARLLEETRAALVELNAATATARAQSEAMRRAAETHDRLTDLVLRGGDVSDLAAEIAALLGGGLVVQDADGTELARVGADSPAPPARGIAASRASGRAVPVDGVWVSAVLAGPEPLGSIALSDRPDLTDSDRRLFERASLDTALLLLLRRSVAEAEDRVRGELLDDLLTPAHAGDPRRAGSLTLRARRLGVDLTEPTSVLVLHCEPGLRSRLTTEAVRHARTLRGLAGPQGGHVVVLAPTDVPGPLAERLAADLGQAIGAPVTCGAAGPAEGPARLPAVHGEAVRCLQALTVLGRTGEGASVSGLGFVGVLLGDRTDIDGYVHRVIGPVIDYDDRRGTELVRTLDAYFEAGTSLSRAKEALHVHVNTVVQRLDRTARLLGPDWNTPDRALELQLALRLNRLRRPSGTGPDRSPGTGPA
ncbi:helix-turn-helix domain-containing protein [Streptomyces aureoverticillatus]|uniref:helix-turn-helix domain-containing protein n=1 Tax=Streptomyces aureoverticillatus TaxID=66871 RepID=UPI0013D91D3C|nr:GAF domain-containing protein [Streptomyces aureoverticillatus]QIB42346.1 GAF domain-containing protein [Streptomyces aureoverticillatus]